MPWLSMRRLTRKRNLRLRLYRAISVALCPFQNGVQLLYYAVRQIIFRGPRDVALFKHVRAKRKIFTNLWPLFIPENELFKFNYPPSEAAKLRVNLFHYIGVRLPCFRLLWLYWRYPHPSYFFLYSFMSRIRVSPANSDDSVVIPISYLPHAVMNTESMSLHVWVTGVSSAINEYFHILRYLVSISRCSHRKYLVIQGHDG